MRHRTCSYGGSTMSERPLRAAVALATLLAGAGVLTACTNTPSCGDAAADLSACTGATAPPTEGGALPTFADGVGMSEWLTYRGAAVRALSYFAGASQVSSADTTQVDALEVEECAPGEHTATLSHDDWTVADSSGDRFGTLAGKLVDGQLTEDPPLTLSPGDCAKTTLAFAVPVDGAPATVHDGPVATWVLPSD